MGDAASFVSFLTSQSVVDAVSFSTSALGTVFAILDVETVRESPSSVTRGTTSCARSARGQRCGYVRARPPLSVAECAVGVIPLRQQSPTLRRCGRGEPRGFPLSRLDFQIPER